MSSGAQKPEAPEPEEIRCIHCQQLIREGDNARYETDDEGRYGWHYGHNQCLYAALNHVSTLRTRAEAAEQENQRLSNIIETLAEQNFAAHYTIQRVREDSERLDWLDEMNAKLNAHYGTTYGWRFNMNHNRNALEDHAIPAFSVREAIDDALAGAAK